MSRGSYLKIIFSSAVAAVIFYFLFSRFAGADLKTNLIQFNWELGILALAMYGLSLALKALRFKFFLGRAIAFRTIYGITAIHSFWNNLLPFRAGELAYFYLLKKGGTVSGSANVVSLLVARLFDAVVVSLLAVISASFLFTAADQLLGEFLRYILLGSAFAVLLVLAIASRWSEKFSLFLGNFTGGREKSVTVVILSRIREALAALSTLKSFAKFAVFLLLSLAIWFGDFLFVWTAFKAGGLNLTPLQGLFITAFPVIAIMIPLQSPAGLGTFEGTLLVGLLALGISGDVGLGASVFLHGQLLLFSFLSFLIATWFRRRDSGNMETPRTNSDLYASFSDPEKDFRNANLSDLIITFARGNTLLDIGCGYGQLLKKAAKLGFAALGVEPDPVAREIARQHYPEVEIIPIEAKNFTAEHCFDTVTVLDVLEDIKEDKQFLQKAGNFVCPGGRLIISAPAFPALYGERDRMMGYFRRYDAQNLEAMLKNLGFNIRLRRYWNTLSFAPYFILYKVLRRSTHAAKLRGGNTKGFSGGLISRVLFWWFKNVENKFNFGFGLTIILVAEKTGVAKMKN